MKKKLIAIAAAAVMMLALPTMAFAAPSPSGTTVTSNGVTFTVKAGSGSIASVEATSAQASNVALTGSEKVLASFEVTGDATDVTLTFNVGKEYAGANVKIFVQHSTDGSTEVLDGKVAADGTVTVTVGKLSIFTIVVDPTTATGSTGANTGSTSPQTGVDFAGVAGGTIAMAVAAGVVFVALRKKVTE